MGGSRFGKVGDRMIEWLGRIRGRRVGVWKIGWMGGLNEWFVGWLGGLVG